MQPKYRQTVSELLNYYMAQRYNNYNLKVYVDDYIVYNGYLECYNGEAAGYDVQEFFCYKEYKEIRIYVTE